MDGYGGMGGGNPYGAVPAALRETRLSLRDIMNDYLLTKVNESKTDLEMAKIDAEMKKDELVSLRDAARLEEDKRRNLALESHAQDSLSQQDRQFTTNLEAQKEQNAVANANAARHTDIMQQQADTSARLASHTIAADAWKNQVKPLGDWMKDIGVSTEIAKAFLGESADLTRPVSGRNAEKVQEGLQKLMIQNPALGLGLNIQGLLNEKNGIIAALKNPNLAPDIRSQYQNRLGEVAGQGARLVSTYNELAKADNAGKAAAIWAKMPPEDQAKYPGGFTDFYGVLRQADRHFKGSFESADLNNIKLTLATGDIDPNYAGTMAAAKRTIETLADKKKAAAIAAGTKQLLEKEDYAGAYQYQTNWARYLSGKKGGVSQPSPAGTGAVLSPVNTQSQAAAENWDQSMRSGLSSLGSVAKDFLKSGSGAIGAAYFEK